MAVSKKDIEHLALLARLNLTSEETTHLSNELGQILKYVDKLKEVSGKAKSVSGNSSLGRVDEVHKFKSPEQLINDAPKSKNGLLSVPPVFED